jgi:hypothetical protein
MGVKWIVENYVWLLVFKLGYDINYETTLRFQSWVKASGDCLLCFCLLCMFFEPTKFDLLACYWCKMKAKCLYS